MRAAHGEVQWSKKRGARSPFTPTPKAGLRRWEARQPSRSRVLATSGRHVRLLLTMCSLVVTTSRRCCKTLCVEALREWSRSQRSATNGSMMIICACLSV
ncbi:uncharacterized protein SCHCODRAFT_02213807 [Schizophyllum commune H4-8]|uniref:uncharacterized protein n=1 Tax=Schizophyllum commune (strain H4-8 / FGSC 9210) TaxID=578458 RepID=UPI00215FA95C|nr:uncharacterized protein SCHCODRAFT_02213807 [Schizophyllum commune H4-8]KAI5894659.1 hypothetical protein SCHCODRAFT_02213807 [Schizophyllum commune H4-8]